VNLIFLDEAVGVDNVTNEFKRLVQAGEADVAIIGLSSSTWLLLPSRRKSRQSFGTAEQPEYLRKRSTNTCFAPPTIRRKTMLLQLCIC
jgi:hypothetical protein